MTAPNRADPSRYPPTMRSDLARYLHDEVNGVGNWDSLSGSQRDSWFRSADHLISRVIDPATDALYEQREAALSVLADYQARSSARHAERSYVAAIHELESRDAEITDLRASLSRYQEIAWCNEKLSSPQPTQEDPQ